MPDLLPLFPLNTVMVPGLVLPLHIFEPRYREMVRVLELRPEADRQFVLAWVRPGGNPDDRGLVDLFPVGVLVQVREITEYPDGRFDISVVGVRRVELLEVDTSRPLLHSSVHLLEDPRGHDDIAEVQKANVTRVVQAFARYRELLAFSTGNDYSPDTDPPPDHVTLSYLITAALVIPTDERAQLLAAPSAEARLALAHQFIIREIKVLHAFHALPAMDADVFRPSPN